MPCCTRAFSSPPRDADLNVTLDIVPDEDNPHAVLSALAADGSRLARVRGAAEFQTGSRNSALQWAANEFRRPA